MIEMLVAMGLFSLVLIIASQAFTKIVSSSTKYAKLEETNIAGVVGLEIMRHDLEQMGFGLPWGWVYLDVAQDPPLVPSGLTYSEATDAAAVTLNDAPNGVPRAFVGLSASGDCSSAFFSVKGTTAGRSQAGPANPAGSRASQYWSYISYHNYSANPRQSRAVKFASNNPSFNDNVLIINSSPSTPALDRMLVVKPGNNNATAPSPPTFFTSFKADGSTDSNFLPANGNSTYLLYDLLGNGDKTLGGTANAAGTTIDAPRMPFNRADYFLKKSGVPAYCDSSTGTLFKAVVNQGTNGGDYDAIPLLDCVADMEVVLGWDISTTNPPDGSVGAYSSLPATVGGPVSATGSSASDIQSWLADPQGLREHLKVVKVYILAQEGRKDTGYTAPSANIEVGDQAADGGLSPKKIYTLTAAQMKYRWKLYRIIVRPKNLYSNS